MLQTSESEKDLLGVKEAPIYIICDTNPRCMKLHPDIYFILLKNATKTPGICRKKSEFSNPDDLSGFVAIQLKERINPEELERTIHMILEKLHSSSEERTQEFWKFWASFPNSP